MIFRQLFEPVSSTSVLGCEESGQALLIEACGRTDCQSGETARLIERCCGDPIRI